MVITVVPGFDINDTAKHKQPLFYCACASGHAHIVRYLVEAGADTTAKQDMCVNAHVDKYINTGDLAMCITLTLTCWHCRLGRSN